MKKTIFTTFAVLTIGMGAMSVQANEAGLYSGVQLGAYDFNMKDGATSSKNSVFGGGIIAGYDSGQNVSAELRLGTTSYSDHSVAPTRIESKLDYMISYVVKPYVEVMPDLNAYALFGATTFKLKNRVGAVSNTYSKTSLSYGLGGSYKLDDGYAINAEWFRPVSNKTFLPNQSLTVDAFTLMGTYSY